MRVWHLHGGSGPADPLGRSAATVASGRGKLVDDGPGQVSSPAPAVPPLPFPGGEGRDLDVTWSLTLVRSGEAFQLRLHHMYKIRPNVLRRVTEITLPAVSTRD